MRTGHNAIENRKEIKGRKLEVILLLLTLWVASLAGVFSHISTNFIQIVFSLCLFAVFSAWGHLLVYPICYAKGRTLEGIIWGTVAGLPLGALIASVIVYLSGWNLGAIIVTLVLLPLLLLIFIFNRKKVGESTAGYQFRDNDILLIALLIVTVFFYFPFKNLGALVDGKYLYTWLFGHDFINRMVHVVSLSKGLPLESYFFSGETLSYYWLAYVYPALLLNIDLIKLETQQLLQMTVFLYSLLAAASLVLFIRSIAAQRKDVLVLIILALCCYSYSYLYVIGIKIWTILTGNQELIIMGANLSKFSGFSHTIYRFFLVQPQASLGMSVMLMLLSLYGRVPSLYGYSVIGLLTGLLFGVDATNGIMLGGWLGCVSLFKVLLARENRLEAIKNHLVALTCAALTYASFFIIGMYSLQTGKGVLELKPSWFVISTSPFYFTLEYGPLFLLGGAGIFFIFKNKERLTCWIYPYILLLGIALFFNFFITNPTEVFFGLLKATRVIPICLLALIIYWWRMHEMAKKTKIVVASLMILALPSFFSDNFIASNLASPSTFVREYDMEAAQWIKNNLPKNAIIQAYPNYPGGMQEYKPKYSYSVIPIFGERKTAIGSWKVSGQEHGSYDKVAERFHDIKKMYFTADVVSSRAILDRYGIEYIFISALEKELFAQGIDKFFTDSCFTAVYSKNGTSIFRYDPIQSGR